VFLPAQIESLLMVTVIGGYKYKVSVALSEHVPLFPTTLNVTGEVVGVALTDEPVVALKPVAGLHV